MLNVAIMASALLRRFRKDEDGAMTVEWVAIAAAVTVGAVGIAWATLNGLDPVTTSIGDSLTDAAGTITSSGVTSPTFGDGQ